MLKGRTLIELVDDKTGERELIHEDNKIGDAVHELLNAYTKWQSGYNLHRQLNPLYATMFGGILLFENAIDESETQVPAGNKIVGAGSYNFSDQLSNVNGDYNMIESEVTDTYVKHVWDFKTNQANGRISSICLCDANYTKYYSYGCDYNTNSSQRLPITSLESTETFALFPFNLGLLNSNGTTGQVPFEFADGQGYILSQLQPLKVYIEDDLTGFVTAHFETETTIVFRKMKIQNNEMNLVPPKLNDYGCMPVAKEIESKTFTLPSTVKSKYAGLSYDIQTQTVHIAYGMTSTSLAVNSSVTIVSFDLSNQTLANATMSQKTFTNKTGEAVKVGSSYPYGTIPVSEPIGKSSSPKNTFHIVDNFIYIAGTDCVYKINLADNTEIFKLEAKGVTSLDTSGIVFDLNGLLYFARYYSFNESLDYYVIDTIKNTAKLSKQSKNFFTPFGYGNSRTFSTKTKQLLVGFSGTYTSVSNLLPTHLVATRNYLSTINNLAQPVVKTNDKTMKVTYILEQE